MITTLFDVGILASIHDYYRWTSFWTVLWQCGCGITENWHVYLSVLNNTLTPQNKKVKAKEKDGRIYKYSPIYICIFK
jgi:hypothetical protein